MEENPYEAPKALIDDQPKHARVQFPARALAIGVIAVSGGALVANIAAITFVEGTQSLESDEVARVVEGRIVIFLPTCWLASGLLAWAIASYVAWSKRRSDVIGEASRQH
jgi:hypothetical protein